ARHAKRYVAGPAPLLEIGAGNRLVPMGLKDLFGDALHITELAPRYSSTKRGVDRELPAATIDRADLPRSAFELAYSFFGTYYSNRQLVVLQKLADSLKVGGEFFGFMKPNGTNRRLMELVARWPMIFYKGGLELVIEDHYFGTPPIGEPALVVSARKCAESIDVGQLFDQARRADKKGGEHEHLSLVSDPSIRLTLDGPRTALSQAEELLPQLIQQVVRWFCQTYKKNPAQLYYQMTGERLVLQSADEPERETLGMQAIVDDLLSLDGLQKLICGVPLTTMLMRHFYPTAKLTTSENVVDTRCAATESLCEWLSALHQ
ncbi:MAG TPA: hypothetical protein VJC18_11770, partial [bacterium]|nr:hypothetical protein [bacterium]